MRIFPLAAVALVTAAALAAAPVHAQKPGSVFPFPYETVTLDNGLTALSDQGRARRASLPTWRSSGPAAATRWSPAGAGSPTSSST